MLGGIFEGIGLKSKSFITLILGISLNWFLYKNAQHPKEIIKLRGRGVFSIQAFLFITY